MLFYDKYVILCNVKGKSPSKIATELGLSPSVPSMWKKGMKPHPAVLKKVCDYFNVTEEYFTEEIKAYGTKTDNKEIICKYYLYGKTLPTTEEWNELLKFVEWQKFKKATKGK